MINALRQYLQDLVDEHLAQARRREAVASIYATAPRIRVLEGSGVVALTLGRRAANDNGRRG